jgi:hypothetical protein
MSPSSNGKLYEIYSNPIFAFSEGAAAFNFLLNYCNNPFHDGIFDSAVDALLGPPLVVVWNQGKGPLSNFKTMRHPLMKLV